MVEGDGVSIWSLFGNAVVSVISSFEIISQRKRELVASLLLCSYCREAVCVLRLLIECWVGL